MKFAVQKNRKCSFSLLFFKQSTLWCTLRKQLFIKKRQYNVVAYKQFIGDGTKPKNEQKVSNHKQSHRSNLCIYTYMSERPEIAYSLRTRNQNKLLTPKTSDLQDRLFIIRSLHKNLYWCDLTNQTYVCLYICHHSILWYLYVCELCTRLRLTTVFKE